MVPGRLALLMLASMAGQASGSAAVSPYEGALLQTWDKALDGAVQKGGAQVTPITRVVNLLKEMQATLKKEMDEDEELYEKLACWCNNGMYEKNQAIQAAEAKIAELESTIEQLTAKSAELKETIATTAAELEADKEALATATATRNKQLKAFHGQELDAIQNVENLKAAIMVLGKHHGGAFPQFSFSFLSVRAHDHRSSNPFGADHESTIDRQFDTFMRKNDMPLGVPSQGIVATDRAVQKFLQEEQGADARHAAVVAPKPPAAVVQGWSADDKAVVEHAIHSASLFLQARGHQSFSEGYAPQSGEILGILKQLKEEMEADLSEEQKTEVARVAAFEELRSAKTAEIAAGEKQLEQKKEELAQTDMDLANAKEDLEEVQAALSEDQKFIINLQKMCADGDKNFELRKKSRLEEIQAVSETIGILTADEARDTFNGAYGFLQLSSRVRRVDGRRVQAARVLRDVATRTHNPQMSVLATSVELDAFTKVKKLIDEMVAMLKTQQEDEVKKKDWCDGELQENEMMTMKAETLKGDQNVKIEDLGSAIQTLGDEITAAKTQIADMQMNLQRASEARVKENVDFQKTVADQKATQEILAKALDKLATFYDKEGLVQTGNRASTAAQAKHATGKQAPPVPEMEYKPSSGASGVMSMIEKLIYDAKELEADSVKSESEAQTQYETFVSDTNASVAELQQAVVTKTEAKAKAEMEKTETEEALEGTMKDMEGLATYLGELHTDCDYVLKNFGVRQEARQQEIEALQQAKQILSGAMMS